MKQRLDFANKKLRALILKQKAITDKVKTESGEVRAFTEDETKAFDELEDEIADAEKEVADAKRLYEADIRAAAFAAPSAPTSETPEAKAKKRYSVLRAINLKAQGKQLDGIEKEMHDEAVNELSLSGQSVRGIGVPSMMMEARRVEVGVAATAGNLVDTNVQAAVPALRPSLVMEACGATMMTGLVGNVDLPIGNQLATAAWSGEHTDEHETTPSVNLVSLRPKRLAAFTEMSRQLMIQTSDSVEAWVRNELSSAIARKVDEAAMNGSGSGNEPEGIINNSGINTIAIGANGGAMTRAKLVEMLTKIATENAEVENMGFIVTPEVRGLLQNLKADEGSGQFVWPSNQINMLLGYKAVTSNLLPKALTKGSGTALHGAIFGNYSDVVIANWGGADLIVDPYTKATKGLVNVVTNTFWDIGVKQAKSFSVCKDISLA